MARPMIHRRSIGVVLLLQLTGLLCPRSDVGVQSFVLRSRPIDDLAAALADVDSNEEEEESEPEVDDVEESEAVDFLNRPSPWSNQWDSSDELERPMIGTYNGFEQESSEDDGRVQQDAGDLSLAEKVFEAIGSRENNDVIIDDNSDQYPLGGGGGYGQEEPSGMILAPAETDGKTPLNKSELKELFDMVTPEAVTEAFPVVTVAKKSEMTKNEVENLFEKVAVADATPLGVKDVLKQTDTVVIVSDAGNASDTGSSDGALPGVKVKTIEELVKTVAKERNSGEAGSGSEQKDVTLDVKEEKLFPDGTEKVTKEWLFQLAQPEDERQNGGEDESIGSLDSTEDGWPSGGRKFKRSLPVANFEEPDVAGDSKSRAVELLKAYIRLQEEENRHLTEALDLATLGQAERTDGYLDEQIEHLRQAVDDERSIEAIRALIKDEEEQQEEEEEAEEEEDVDDFSRQDEEDTIGDMPLILKRSRPDFDNENPPSMPELLAFDDDGDVNFVDDVGESGNDVISIGDAEEEERLKARLREYALQRELAEIRQAAADAAFQQQQADADYAGREQQPEIAYLPADPNYQTTFRDSRRFNPFLRDYEQSVVYRPSYVATKRFEPIKIRKYAADDDLVGEDDSDDEDEERRREELEEVEAAIRAAEEEEQRREFIENLEEALELPVSAEGVDDDDDDADEGRPLISDSGVCPALEELTDNCLVARERGLTLDDEALQLCNRHQLCYSCGDQYGLLPDACDRGYLADADRLCSDPRSADASSSRCRREAASLYVMMLDGHRAHSGSGYAVPEVCRLRCTFDIIVGGGSSTMASRRRR